MIYFKLETLLLVVWLISKLCKGQFPEDFDFDEMGMDGMQVFMDEQAQGFGKHEKKAPVVKSDIKYIKCGVCTEIVKQADDFYTRMAEAKGKQLMEYDIIDHIENMCDPDKSAGTWLNMCDIQEKGDKLEVVNMRELADCGVECRTLAKACDDIMGNYDTDMAEAMYARGVRGDDLHKWLCLDKSSACAKPPPPVPKDRTPGPKFFPLSPDEQQVRSTMRSMKMQGMSGRVYDRSTVERQMEMMKQMGGQMGLSEDQLSTLMGQAGAAGAAGAGDGSGQGKPQEQQEERPKEPGVDLYDMFNGAYQKTKDSINKVAAKGQQSLEQLAGGDGVVGKGVSGVQSLWEKAKGVMGTGTGREEGDSKQEL